MGGHKGDVRKNVAVRFFPDAYFDLRYLTEYSHSCSQ